MVRDAGSQTFLVGSLHDYTQFLIERGNDAGAGLIRRFMSVSRGVVAEHHGEVVGFAGDQLVAVFDASQPALLAALEMQRRSMEGSVEETSHALKMAIGVEAGTAIPVEGNYVGYVVNLAARLSALAGPGEVLVGPQLRKVTAEIPSVGFVEFGEVQLKGFPNPVRVSSAASM